MTEHPEPLTPVVYHILLALSEGPLYGYGITAAIEAATEGDLRMGPGTLYGSLGRMEGWGLVEPVQGPTDEEEEGGRRDGRKAKRRYYGLTPAGLGALKKEARRLERDVALARARRVLEGGA